MLALLLGFYDVSEGDVLIDGQSISQVSRRSLRGQTAYVGQDVYLFRDTIRANIAFGKDTRRRPRSEKRRRRPAPMILSWAFRLATTLRSASTARNSPVASASALPSPAPS